LGANIFTLNHGSPLTDYVVVGRSLGDSGLLAFSSGAISHTASVGLVVLGRDLGSLGQVNLSGTGRWDIACTAIVGNNGTGLFNQSGTTTVTFNQNDVNTNLYVGMNNHGIYNLQGGILTANVSPGFVEGIGVNSNGTFNQTGGFNNTRSLQ